MPNFKIFGNEPAVITAVISAALSLVVTLGVGLSGDQAGAWVAVISGVFAVVAAWHTRPVAPAVFTGLVQVTAALLAAYHFNVAPATVGAINVFVIAVLTLLTRGQVSPAPTAAKPATVPVERGSVSG
jgi:hypothetical protein